MTFAIDTGEKPAWSAKSAVVDDTQNIRFTSWARADRSKRQVIAEIEACEFAKDVDDYLHAESILIDALFLFDPVMADSIADAAEAHKAILKSGGVEAATPDPHPAEPGNVLNKTF